MKVFKFGGASVNNAIAVQNMAAIIKRYSHLKLIIVISAMGKTTNNLELLVPLAKEDLENSKQIYDQLWEYHATIVKDLFGTQSQPVLNKIAALFTTLKDQLHGNSFDYNFNYDQIVSFGELISTTIVSEYLTFSGMENQWVDVRELIKTDTTYREGKVDWELTQRCVQKSLLPLFAGVKTIITQGFIAGTEEGTTTTLGREGSDYSAAILAYCTSPEAMVIWKDVSGFLNADPKYFENTKKIDKIPYNEAIELAYYGASIIHPKTVKPLQNKKIPLLVKSFVTPESEGSIIDASEHIEPEIPLYIFKNKQVLLSILPKDFSFIAEDNLQKIFGDFAKMGMKVNLMQNSALSFSVCMDSKDLVFDKLIPMLQNDFKVRYNDNLQLITIRYYTEEIIDSIVNNREIFLEQRSRLTAQLLVGKEQR